MTKILLVEDSTFICKVVEEFLPKEYYKVVSVSKGNSTIATALNILPDIILLSLILEDTHGFEVCKMLKAHKELAKTPVIFITSSDDEDLISEAFELGAVDYITKPFTREDFCTRVKRHSKK